MLPSNQTLRDSFPKGVKGEGKGEEKGGVNKYHTYTINLNNSTPNLTDRQRRPPCRPVSKHSRPEYLRLPSSYPRQLESLRERLGVRFNLDSPLGPGKRFRIEWESHIPSHLRILRKQAALTSLGWHWTWRVKRP